VSPVWLGHGILTCLITIPVSFHVFFMFMFGLSFLLLNLEKGAVL
jgi:hypothetical protein